MTHRPADHPLPQTAGQRRFGAFAGVFLPSLLSILGIILYLRLGWTVGHAGLGGALLILLLSHLISALTGLSVSSLATSRTVGVGGAYYMISRALGAPAGVAVGIPLYFAQALSVGFYVVGFTEVLSYLLPWADPRLSGSLALGGLALLTLVSTDLTIRTQYLVFGAILLSLFSLFTAHSVEPSPAVDWWDRGEPGLMAVFAVFFPAVTGIMAGVGMSGDLRTPRRDLPLGVLTAIAAGFLIYGALILLLVLRADPLALAGDRYLAWHIARYPDLVSLGVLSAALSSALGGLLAAPRTLQAIAADGFAPAVFARAEGRTREPRGALVLTLVLAETAVLAGNLNLVATLLTLFFLVTYGATNLACALETWAANPGFRPGFRVPWGASALGALACFAAMGAIHLPAMLLALGLVTALYLWADRRYQRVRFGDDRFGIWAALVRSALYRLQRTPASPAGWRPNLIVFSEATPRRSFLLRLASALVRDSGVVTLFHLLVGDATQRGSEARRLEARLQESLNRTFPAVFCRVAVVHHPFAGMPAAVQAYGIGRLAANTVMLGWPARRRHWKPVFRIWRELLTLGKSVILVGHEGQRPTDRLLRIDLWWTGGAGNGAMLVLLGYLLSQHEGERRCHLRLLAAARTDTGRRRAHQALEEMAGEAHVGLETRIVALTQPSLRASIAAQSADADLVMVGVHPPQLPQDGHGFMEAQAQLMAPLPTTLLVSSARGFEGRETLFEDQEGEGER